MFGDKGEKKALLSTKSAEALRKSYDSTSVQVALIDPEKGKSETQAADEFHEPVTYTWENINVWIGKDESVDKSEQNCCSKIFNCCKSSNNGNERVTKHILRNVSGYVRPGELLAIMGASGAGKTSLLNALTFRSSGNYRISGDRCINGVPIAPDILTSLAAYVQQEDLFIGLLTVREHLIFQSLVRMGRKFKYSERTKRVQEVIEELGLTKCAETIIGVPGRRKGISGGEMKRLSFASEVLTDCQLVFADEPTSGLDSYMAQNVVEVLREMASKGKTIVCTIHQPASEIYALFDRLMLLSEGRVAYFGDANHAVSFFQQCGHPCPANFNPADFFIETLATKPGREDECSQTRNQICDSYDNSELASEVKALVEQKDRTQSENIAFLKMQASLKKRSRYKASWCTQFRALLWRSWISIVKEPMVLKSRIIQTVVIAVLLGIVFHGQDYNQTGVINLNGALFLFLTNVTYEILYTVINLFSDELPLFMREHFAGMYRVEVYLLAKTIAELPLLILFPFMLTSTCYYIIGFNPDWQKFLITSVIVILVANVSSSFGYMISGVSSSMTMAHGIAPVFLTPFMLFGGIYLNNGSAPAYFSWIKYFSWFFYGYESLVSNQWDGVDSIECSVSNQTCPRTGAVVLQSLNFNKDNLFPDIGCLMALIVGYRFIAYVAILMKTLRKR